MAKRNIKDVAIDAATIGGKSYNQLFTNKGFLSSIKDWNEILEPGIYELAIIPSYRGENAPETYFYGMLLVFNQQNSYNKRYMQIYIPEYHSNLSVKHRNPQYRTHVEGDNSGWSDWKYLALLENVENTVTSQDLKSILSDEQISLLNNRIEQRLVVQQTSNNNDMNISNLQMGGGV